MVSPGVGLTVVVPTGFDHAQVADIVAGRLDWVEHHLERLARLAPAPEEAAPQAVELRAVGRVVAVRYKAGTGPVNVRQAGELSLLVSGTIARRDMVARGLRSWLKREGLRELPAMLEGLSACTGLGFSGITVRMQRTRWGSCSAKGAISLNARLLFLPPELARYVLLHELAHTVHMNHSGDYWRFLERLHPDALALDRALRQARRFVPAWAAD